FELLPSETDMDRNNIVTRLLAAKLGLPAPGPEPPPAVGRFRKKVYPSTGGRGVRARRGRLRGRRGCPSRGGGTRFRDSRPPRGRAPGSPRAAACSTRPTAALCSGQCRVRRRARRGARRRREGRGSRGRARLLRGRG